MPSPKKIALGTVAGVVGSTVVAWRALCPWLKYDLQIMKVGSRTQKLMMSDIEKGRFLIEMFEEDVQRHPKKPFLIFEDRIYTYEFVNDQANRVANIAQQWNIKVGETVAIMIHNEPAFIWTFLGLQKLGIGVAFINHHLRHHSLVHVIKACEAKVLILGEGEEILNSVEEIRQDLEGIPLYVQGRSLMLGEGYVPWDDLMLHTLPVSVCKSCREGLTLSTPCCYIFTSGTTGLPKPVIINQAKAIGISKFFSLLPIQSDDILYATTPLYHSAAGGLGLMSTIDVGATMVLRKKFSAHHYWEDVRRHKATIVQYIGELCRYLLAVPESPLDGVHNVKMAVGNGLREDIWEKFQKRFKIPIIREFYGATEGTTAMINVSDRIGACGRMSPLLKQLSPTKSYVVKFDPETDAPYRNTSGHCVVADIGEPGILLGGVPAIYSDLKFYKGDKSINEKKIERDVFVKGDLYFNFGDLIQLDKDYFMYFKDRVGDTFRWKGENVSTYEVANILTELEFVHDATVYGVRVPGTDGRAGMAAIHLQDKLSLTKQMLQEIYHHCEENLPSYSRPLFLRFPPEASLTTTMKQLKYHYVKDGFDPNTIKDPLFYKDDHAKTYVPLTSDNYSSLLKSKL